MNERQALLSAILNDVEEDTPRLVFADWLDENGEPERAEFFRLQCRDARRTEEAPAPVELQERVAQLGRVNVERWLGPLAGHVPTEHLPFARGLAYLTFTEAAFTSPEVQAAATAAFPVLGVEYLGLSPASRIRSPLVGLARFILSLGAEGMVRETSAMDQIAQSPALAWVAKLALWYASTSDRALGYLAASPYVARLSELHFQVPRCTDAGLRALAGSDALPNLRKLAIWSAGGPAGSYTAAGVRAVLGSPRLPKLNGLAVSSWVPTTFDLRALLSDPAAARLRRLSAGTADALGVVARTTHLSALKELQIDGPQPVVTDRDAEAFLNNPALAGVNRLWLMNVRQENVQLSAGVEARLRERFGDGFAVAFHPLP